MDLEGNASIVQQILRDLGELFHRLESMALIHPGFFHSIEYVKTVSSEYAEALRQMIVLTRKRG